jgi:hypothetical protein
VGLVRCRIEEGRFLLLRWSLPLLLLLLFPAAVDWPCCHLPLLLLL